MILLTGGGAFFEAFQKVQPCSYLSLRRTHETTLRSTIERAVAIVHNAANIQPRSAEEAVRDNFLPTFRLLGLCLAHNPGIRFVYLGSMSYLESEVTYLPVEEMTHYAYSKYLSETFCLKSSLPNVHTVRFSTLFYKNPERDGLSKLVADAVQRQEITIYNGGEAHRDFIPIEIAAGYVAKIIRQKPTGKVFNIAAGEETSFGNIAGFLQNSIPGLKVTDLPVPVGKPVLSRFSNPASRLLGQIPFSLEAQIDRYIRQLRDTTA